MQIKILLRKIKKSLQNNGLEATIEKCRLYFSFANTKVKDLIPSENSLNNYKHIDFRYKPIISILVPLYNTDIVFLKDMVSSVANQTYPNWELCLADGSDEAHSYIKEYFDSIRDKRIKYKKITNSGISGNTNECVKIASGDYIALLDHDDILLPQALTEVVKQINKYDADFIYSDEATCDIKAKHVVSIAFKPDFSIDFLRTNNYLCHFTTFKKNLLNLVGVFDSECDGAQDFDMFLRLTEKAKTIKHISKVLYLWRQSPTSTALTADSKPRASIAGQTAIEKHLKRVGLKGIVSVSDFHPFTYKISYSIEGNPKISILMLNQDHKKDLEKCINSIITKTTWTNYEIIIVDNNSISRENEEYYKQRKDEQNPVVKTIRYEYSNDDNNYSRILNYGVKFCTGEYWVLLNNNIEVITKNWLEQMLMYAQRKDIGAVGAKLYFPNNKIQQGGIIVGLKGVAGSAFYRYPRHSTGYMGLLKTTKNLSAVSATCMMIKKKIFEEVGGFSEDLPTIFYDIDFCLKIRELGYFITWTPYAELYIDEPRNYGHPKTEQEKRNFEIASNYMKIKWSNYFKEGDPYYNQNLSLVQGTIEMQEKGN